MTTIRSALSKSTVQGVIALVLVATVVGGFFMDKIDGEAIIVQLAVVTTWLYVKNGSTTA